MCLTCYSYWKESEAHQWPLVILHLTNTTSIGFQHTIGQDANKSDLGSLLQGDQMIFQVLFNLGCLLKFYIQIYMAIFQTNLLIL